MYPAATAPASSAPWLTHQPPTSPAPQLRPAEDAVPGDPTSRSPPHPGVFPPRSCPGVLTWSLSSGDTGAVSGPGGRECRCLGECARLRVQGDTEKRGSWATGERTCDLKTRPSCPPGWLRGGKGPSCGPRPPSACGALRSGVGQVLLMGRHCHRGFDSVSLLADDSEHLVP